MVAGVRLQMNPALHLIGDRIIRLQMSTTFTVALIRKVFVAIAGFTVLLIGIAMMVLPGPAIVVIPLGLAILATEFVWARSLLKKTRETIAGKTPDSLKRKPKTNAVGGAE